MSVRNGMRPVHPGEVLRDEIDALDMSAKALAQELDVPPNRITAILHGQRGVTADTALRLSRYLGTTSDVDNKQISTDCKAVHLGSIPGSASIY